MADQQTVSFSLEKVVSMLIAKQLQNSFVCCEFDDKVNDTYSWGGKYVDARIFYTQAGITHCIFLVQVEWYEKEFNPVAYELQLTCDCKEKRVSCSYYHSVSKEITCKSQYTGQSVMRLFALSGTITFFDGKLGYVHNTGSFKEYFTVNPEQVFNVFKQITTYYFHKDPYGRSHECK